MPFLATSFETIRNSIRQHGIRYPLAVNGQGQVLDGRYRLRAAQELGISTVPALTVKVTDVLEFIWLMKGEREHLNDWDRAMLAEALQQEIKTQNIKERTKKMNDARTGKSSPAAKADKGERKDSRKEATARLNAPRRKTNAIGKLQKSRPDLHKKMTVGKMRPEAAVKQMGKDRNAERAKVAATVTVRKEVVVDHQLENAIHVGMAADVLKKVRDATASLVTFSPPYYGVSVQYDPPLPKVSYRQYLDDLAVVIAESLRVSRVGGRMAIVLDTVHNPEGSGDWMLPVFADIVQIAKAAGWKFYDELPWIKHEAAAKTAFGSLGLNSAPGFARIHEWILLFCKDQEKFEGDSLLCDLTRDDHLAWRFSSWEIPAETRKEVLDQHPAPYPEPLVERLVKLLTYRRDLVIDPYNGSGTTTAVARRLGRRYIGIDRSAKYVEFAQVRCANSALKSGPEAESGSGELA